MNSQLSKLYGQIEVQREQLLAQVSPISQEQLQHKPAVDQWSVREVISHLIVAERLSLLYLQKKVKGADQATDTGVWEELKMIALKISQRIPGLKFKAPRFVVENTKVYSDLTTLEKEWTSVRKDLHDFLEAMEERHINRRIYKHARAGYLNVRHAVQFFGEHVTHHTPQIKKLLKKA